jgi:hypothetical protein
MGRGRVGWMLVRLPDGVVAELESMATAEGVDVRAVAARLLSQAVGAGSGSGSTTTATAGVVAECLQESDGS